MLIDRKKNHKLEQRKGASPISTATPTQSANTTATNTATNTEKSTETTLPTDLQQAFHFTLADLQHNRNGEISEAQHRRNLNRVTNNLAVTLGIVGALVFLFGLAVVANLSGLPDFDGLLLTALSVLLGIMIVASTLFGLRLRRIDRAAHEDALRVIEGPAHLKQVLAGYGVAQWVQVADESFILNRRQFNALHAGQRYRFYTLAGISSIVSVEPL